MRNGSGRQQLQSKGRARFSILKDKKRVNASSKGDHRGRAAPCGEGKAMMVPSGMPLNTALSGDLWQHVKWQDKSSHSAGRRCHAVFRKWHAPRNCNAMDSPRPPHHRIFEGTIAPQQLETLPRQGGGVLCTQGPWIMQCTIMHDYATWPNCELCKIMHNYARA